LILVQFPTLAPQSLSGLPTQRSTSSLSESRRLNVADCFRGEILTRATFDPSISFGGVLTYDSTNRAILFAPSAPSKTSEPFFSRNNETGKDFIEQLIDRQSAHFA